jgi:transcriptional regulator GlxA family with amidase domain
LSLGQVNSCGQLCWMRQSGGSIMNRKAVGILIFPDVEVLDFAGPFEVFSVTRLDEERRRSDLSPFDVFLVAEKAEPVVTTGGMQVAPQFTIDDCPALEVLVAPGGWGTRAQTNNGKLIQWIRERAPKTPTLTSVCTGSFLLGAAGLLEGRRATTHWASLDRMSDTFPTIEVERNLHVVEEGNLFTSAGISAGIDMSLRVVARYFGEAVARATARHMEYPYPETNKRRI